MGSAAKSLDNIASLPKIRCMSRIVNAPVNVAVAILFAVAVSPAFLVDIPAMGDYSNHLARMHILAAAGTSEANPFYEVTWNLYPNLAMDLIVPQVGKFMGIEAATKTFFLLSQILLVTGAIAIELAVKGRHELSGFAALMALYSLPFAWGFLNFQFGLGLALWSIAAWIAMRSRSWPARLAVHSLLVPILFVAHIFALGIYGATIGLYELTRRPFDTREAVGSSTILVAPVAVVFCVVVWSGGTFGGGAVEWRLDSKFLSACCFLNGNDGRLAIIALAVLVGIAFVLFRSRSVSLTRQGRWIAVGFLALFIAMPFRVSAAYTDVRVVVAALLIIPAFTVVSLESKPAIALAASLSCGVILVNAAHTAYVWRMHESNFAEVQSSFRLITRNATILVGTTTPSLQLEEAPIQGAPVLASHHAKAHVHSLYIISGVNPIRLRPKFAHLDLGATGFVMPTVSELHSRPERMNGFEYLYLLGPRIPNPMPDRLNLIADGTLFALYQIRSSNP